jgi:hypothetical protein
MPDQLAHNKKRQAETWRPWEDAFSRCHRPGLKH